MNVTTPCKDHFIYLFIYDCLTTSGVQTTKYKRIGCYVSNKLERM